MMTMAVGLGLVAGFILFLYVLDALVVGVSRRSAADKERKE